MSQYRIAIVNSSSFGRRFPLHMERLESIGEVCRMQLEGRLCGKELADQLKGYNMIIASVTPSFDREFFRYKDELLLISRHGIGYNNVDLEAAEEHGTCVSIVQPSAERDAVAENAVANLMCVMRMTLPAVQAAKENRWHDRAQFVGYGLSGKTVGVIGCGNIGSRIAEILKHGFNTRLLACDPALNREWAAEHGIEEADLDTLFREADVISLNCTLNETSYHILNDEAFHKMKKGIYITNTARGDLIDEEAVCRALEMGIVRGMAVDVMHDEPADSSHPYFRYDNVLVTPHTSAYTIECLERMGEKCVCDVERISKNEVPDCCKVLGRKV